MSNKGQKLIVDLSQANLELFGLEISRKLSKAGGNVAVTFRGLGGSGNSFSVVARVVDKSEQVAADILAREAAKAGYNIAPKFATLRR